MAAGPFNLEGHERGILIGLAAELSPEGTSPSVTLGTWGQERLTFGRLGSRCFGHTEATGALHLTARYPTSVT
jgi:hypothetical protein